MNSNNVAEEITPSTLKKRLDAGDKPVILDVREPHEIKICALPNTINIPLGDLRFRLGELDSYKDQEIVVYCRSGKRSAMGAAFMKESGFKQVINLAGGILAWSDEVDPSFQKY